MNLLRFDSEDAWVNGVCAFWTDRLRTNPGLKMCLPSGATPAAVYGRMAQRVAAGHASFGRASIFALDEFGGLPADEPGLTGNTLRSQIVDRVDLPAAAFHGFSVSPDAAANDQMCAAYDRAVGAGFDLVILGIGVNGHLGMNEPGSAPDSGTRRVDLHESTTLGSARYFPGRAPHELPRWGVTVGLAAILAAAEVWVLATGSAKTAILRRAFEREVTPDVPASLLRHHPNCSVFVDAAAGALL
jgi:glucosamine-6-phosphate deaminase